MNFISFLSEPKTYYKCDIVIVSGTVVQLTFIDKVPEKNVLLSGFNLVNEHNKANMSGSQYHSYFTIYKKESDLIYMLSKDESVWVEPEEKEEVPEARHVKTLKEVYTAKIEELSKTCNATITQGVAIAIDNKIKYFSYSEEDQTNIKELFDVAVQTQVPQYYHANGEMCEQYSVANIILLYVGQSLNKLKNITYYNQLKAYTNSLNDIASVSAVYYGQALIGDYLNTYLDAINQAETGFSVLLGDAYPKNLEVIAGFDPDTTEE